jgi:hypothetical protein
MRSSSWRVWDCRCCQRSSVSFATKSTASECSSVRKQTKSYKYGSLFFRKRQVFSYST